MPLAETHRVRRSRDTYSNITPHLHLPRVQFPKNILPVAHDNPLAIIPHTPPISCFSARHEPDLQTAKESDGRGGGTLDGPTGVEADVGGRGRVGFGDRFAQGDLNVLERVVGWRGEGVRAAGRSGGGDGGPENEGKKGQCGDEVHGRNVVYRDVLRCELECQVLKMVPKEEVRSAFIYPSRPAAVNYHIALGCTHLIPPKGSPSGAVTIMTTTDTLSPTNPVCLAEKRCSTREEH